MTNVPSGSKRAWEGTDTRGSKKHRADSRDWRDVHLESPGSRKSTSGRWKDDGDRRHSDSHRRRDDPDRSDVYRRRHPSSRSRSRTRIEQDRLLHDSSSRHSSYQPANDVVIDDEREEGELSPIIHTKQHADASVNDDVEQLTPKSQEPIYELELELAPSPSPEELIEARRARRQAILSKYNTSTSSEGANSSSAVQPQPQSSVISDQSSLANSANGSADIEQAHQNMSKHHKATSPSPGPGRDFNLVKDDAEEDSHRQAQEENSKADGAHQVSAADYDPSLDRREDDHKRVPEKTATEVLEVEEEEEEEEDDLDDMFAVASDKHKKVKKVKRMKPAAPALVRTTLDSAADSEGYYSIILGEQLDGGRYQVFSSLGKGMFANVVRARVLQNDPGEVPGREVAIKIVRCQESMYKAGLKEIQMLHKLKQADPEDKKHIVRLERSFEHRGHLCLVFESLSMNLRDIVKRFGKDVGLNIRAVRAYAQQLFLALSLLKKLNVMHADIKPDNILVNEHKTVIKLCDLGSASDAVENDITPYLVSRFYRAPEIILGYPYDPSLDVWSIGCTLYELYTGKILFPGRSNNQMLLLMMQLKGRFNTKMLKKSKFGDIYFDEMGAFQSLEVNRSLGTEVVRKTHITKASRDLRARLMPSTSVKMREEESKMLISFIDLLEKCLTLDPSRRITPKEALIHPFIRG